MSGTDHSNTPSCGAKPTVILVRPQMGENIGAAARAMWNFGLDRMRLVAPRDGWPNEKAVAMASGAGRVLDQVIVSETTAGAIGDLHYVYATTARGRDLTKPVLTPQEAMDDARGRIAQGQNVGVLFGAERAGLENTDIVQAQALVSVPVNPAFGSLNLAQCVLLMAYEWQRETGGLPTNGGGKGVPAKAVEQQHLIVLLEERLEASRYFWPPNRAESMRENLHNLFPRLELTDADIRTLHGIFRALADRHPTQK